MLIFKFQGDIIMEKNDTLLTEPVGKLLFKLSVPTLLAQLVNLLYSVVDRIYVGHIPVIGTDALSGLGVTFPIIMLISAFSALVGMGGAPRAAIYMGKGENDMAEKILGNCVSMLIIVSLILSGFFYLTKEPIILTFGGSDITLPYANSYLSIYLIGTIFVQIALGLNTFITTQGKTNVSMFTICIGAFLNIILDPIFIFGFNMGVKGAALATILSQAVCAVFVIAFLCSKHSNLKIKLKYLTPNLKIALPVLALGLAPFIMQSTECLIQLTFNKSVKFYGNDNYVALMSILFTAMQLVFMPLQGFTQGAQPIISYNYGAKNYDRVKKTFSILIKSAVTFSAISVGLIEIFPRFFLGLFTADQELINLGITPLRVFLFGMIIMGAQTACQTAFLAIGETKSSMFLAILRKIVLLIPLALIMPRIFGLGINGVFLSEPISDILAITITLIYFYKVKDKFFSDNSQKSFAQQEKELEN